MNNENKFSKMFRYRWPVILVMCLLVASLGVFVYYRLVPPEVEVYFIDVGLDGAIGDAILLQSSEGEVVMIDGGEPNAAALTYLKSRNINHIDRVVITHMHEDHYGGMIEILKTIPVDQLIMNGDSVNDPIFAEFMQTVEDVGVETLVVKSGDRIPFGRLSFQVLSPRKINPNSVNNNSIVLRLQVGKVSFLFTGDMMELEEGRLLAVGAAVDVDILKIAHHGADTSSSPAFLVEVSPTVAIYSVGKGNGYLFPHEKTMENLKAVGARVYGTDVNGTIAIITDGSDYEVITEKGEPVIP